MNNIKTVFEMCKETIGENIKYVKALENHKYEAHESRRGCTLIYVLVIINNKIKILEEKEAKRA